MRSADFEKPKKYFRLIMNHKTSKKVVSRKKIRSESFSIRTSEGRAPASELVLQREACLPRLHYKGETSSPKWCIEG